MTLALPILAATRLIGLIGLVYLAVVAHPARGGHEPTYDVEHGGGANARRAWLDRLTETTPE